MPKLERMTPDPERLEHVAFEEDGVRFEITTIDGFGEVWERHDDGVELRHYLVMRPEVEHAGPEVEHDRS